MNGEHGSINIFSPAMSWTLLKNKKFQNIWYLLLLFPLHPLKTTSRLLERRQQLFLKSTMLLLCRHGTRSWILYQCIYTFYTMALAGIHSWLHWFSSDDICNVWKNTTEEWNSCTSWRTPPWTGLFTSPVIYLSPQKQRILKCQTAKRST